MPAKIPIFMPPRRNPEFFRDRRGSGFVKSRETRNFPILRVIDETACANSGHRRGCHAIGRHGPIRAPPTNRRPSVFAGISGQ